MSFSDFLAHNSFLMGIVTIIIFLLYQFYLKPKYIDKKEDKPSEAPIEKPTDIQDNSIKERMKRGFNAMKDKVQNNEFVKNIKEVNKTEQEDPYGMESKENPFATDFSDLKKLDF